MYAPHIIPKCHGKTFFNKSLVFVKIRIEKKNVRMKLNFTSEPSMFDLTLEYFVVTLFSCA